MQVYQSRLYRTRRGPGDENAMPWSYLADNVVVLHFAFVAFDRLPESFDLGSSRPKGRNFTPR